MSEWTVGTPVRFWTGVREGEGRTGTLKHDGVHECGGTPGVYIAPVDGRAVGFVALTHVERLDGGADTSPRELRDAKRTVGGFAKFAATATPLEQEVWKRCQVEFGHRWITTATDVRDALVRARCALFLEERGVEWTQPKPAHRRSCKREALRGPDPACDGCAGFTIAFDPSLTPEQVKGVLTALADYYRACGGAGFAVEVAS
jgi:hypothetical protein